MTRKQKNTLVEIFNALVGVVSEMGAEFFDQFYADGNGEKMMNDFEDLLMKVTPESFQNTLMQDGVKK